MNNKQLPSEKAQPLEGSVPPGGAALAAGRTTLDAGQPSASRTTATARKRTTWKQDVIWSCGLPRAYKDHHTAKGRAYRQALESLLALYPKLPRPAADPLLREYGKCVVELADLSGERAVTLRNQLMQLQYSLASLAGGGARKAQPAPEAPVDDLEHALAKARARRA